MTLKELLLKHRISQAAIWRISLGERADGYGALDQGELCKIVNGRRKATPSNQRAIKTALLTLGVSEAEIDAMPEMAVFTYGRRAKRNRCPTCHGRGLVRKV